MSTTRPGSLRQITVNRQICQRPLHAVCLLCDLISLRKAFHSVGKPWARTKSPLPQRKNSRYRQNFAVRSPFCRIRTVKCSLRPLPKSLRRVIWSSRPAKNSRRRPLRRCRSRLCRRRPPFYPRRSRLRGHRPAKSCRPPAFYVLRPRKNIRQCGLYGIPSSPNRSRSPIKCPRRVGSG